MSDSDLAPALLVAMPQLQDPNFRRAVVLLVEHDEDGTFGLVVNRPLDLRVGALCESLAMRWNGEPSRRVGWGGPVRPDHGWVLAGDDEVESLELRPVADGIQVSSSPEVLRSLAEEAPQRFGIFLGYAGWGPGQLGREIAQGSWIVAPVSSRFVFDTACDDVWERVLRSLGIDPATLVATQGVN